MKSKSFQLPSNAVDKVKQNKTYDFVNLYKSAGETSLKPVEKRKSDDGSCKENVAANKLFSPRRVANKKKKKTQNESIDVSKINTDGDSLLRTVEDATYDSKVTSTPNADKNDMKLKVKPIIKTKPPIDESLDISNVSISSKPKKRNKSVSFMLDDSEGVAIKRSKSEETVHTPRKQASKSLCKTKKPKKLKQKLQDEENKGDANNISIDNVSNENIVASQVNNSNRTESPENVNLSEEKSQKKKRKKIKTNPIYAKNPELVINESGEPKIKKIKKKKHIKLDGTDNIDREGEPAPKTSKKDIKPEIIAQDLENLNIGDNAHTLTNLLDEMTVVDKNKKKKSKQKDRKQKKDRLRESRNTVMAETTEGSEEKKKTKEDRDKIAESNVSISTNTAGEVSEGSVTKKKRKQKKQRNKSNVSTESSNIEGEVSEGIEEKKKQKQKKQKSDKMDIPIESINSEGEVTEEKEKVKWVNRKWNKDKKAAASAEKYLTTIIIENLPLKLLFTYKKLLAEHFGKFGMIRQVGIAEIYPMEDPKPVFTTTINFYSEDAAEKALEEDNTLVEGARVRVKRALPPTLSTLVVRSYAQLTEQALSSVFSGAGRVRSIRHLLKGRKSLSTSFVEFDGPKSVERAIKMAEEVKIGGKKIHVSKFELRGPKPHTQDTAPQDGGSEESS